jgi:hypothetical protein
MKPHWKDGGAILRAQIAELLREPYRLSDGGLSPAESWYQAAQLAWSNQLDIEPPPHSATDRVKALRDAKDFETLNEEYRSSGLNFEHERETRYLVRWTAMRKWASEPSSAELAAVALKQAEAASHEAAIEARAQQLLAEENRATLERARKRARKEAEAAR